MSQDSLLVRDGQDCADPGGVVELGLGWTWAGVSPFSAGPGRSGSPPPLLVLGEGESPPLLVPGEGEPPPLLVLREGESTPLQVPGEGEAPPLLVPGEREAPPLLGLGDGKAPPLLVLGEGEAPFSPPPPPAAAPGPCPQSRGHRYPPFVCHIQGQMSGTVQGSFRLTELVLGTQQILKDSACAWDADEFQNILLR
eukprot:g27387.t1